MTYEGNTLKYTVVDEYNKTCRIRESNRVPGVLLIPAKAVFNDEEYTVTEISYGAFQNSYQMTSVEIPYSVTSIGDYAFKDCTSLKEIIIADGESTLDFKGSVFSGVEFTKLYLGRNISYNGASYQNPPFSNKKTLTELVIGNSVTKIASSAFYGCGGLTVIKIPNSVNYIGDRAFAACSGLNSLSIGNSVTTIGFSAFYGCSSLNTIEIPNSVKSIGFKVFGECSGLKEITIADGEKTLDFAENVFYKTSLNKLYLGRNFTYTYNNSEYELFAPFYNKISLKELIIGNSVTSIGYRAFENCSGLTSVVMDNSLTSLGYRAFKNCSGLTSIEIPNSVNSIGSEAFSGCSGLISIEIPNSVNSIGSEAFSGCSGLTSVKIPNSVISIGDSAFSDCSGLTSVKIPNSVISIGMSAFTGCRGLISVTIPESIAEMGESAFYGCNGLTSVYYNSEDPIDAHYNIFLDPCGEIIYNQATLYVPARSVEKCKRIEPWKNFKNILSLDFTSGIQEINEDIDESLPYEVFSLDGHRVSGDLDSLSPGIYIIRQGNTVKKIAVK